MTLTIGLTGGIASGKSTVSTMLKDLNIPVIDADLIARDVVEPGEEAYYEIIKTFGEDIVNVDGTINREKLGSIVFYEQEKRIRLNEIVHPAIRKRMLKQKEDYIKQSESAIILDIPLLYESKLTHLVEKVIVVTVEPSVQLSRLMNRNNLSESEALARIKSQMLLEEKVKLADAVINNNGTLVETKQQLHDILQKWDIL